MASVERKIRRSRFSITPERVARKPKQSKSARLLYITYKSICGEKEGGACWMTMKSLEIESGLSANTITRARRELVAAGLITVTQRRRGGEIGHRLVVRIVNLWTDSESDVVSTDGGLRQVADSSYTPVQSDTTKAPIANSATRPSQILRRNKNTTNKNHSSSSSTSNEIEYQATHRRRPAASSERHPVGANPSGDTNSGIEETQMSNRLQSQTNQPQGTRMAGFDLDGVGTPPADATYDDHAAARLIEAVARKMKLLRKPRTDVWSKDITKFRRLNEVSEADFEERLAWFIAHIDDPFVPIVHSAKGFCDKIDQIGAAKVRSETPMPSAKKKESVEDVLQELRRRGVTA